MNISTRRQKKILEIFSTLIEEDKPLVLQAFTTAHNYIYEHEQAFMCVAISYASKTYYIQRLAIDILMVFKPKKCASLTVWYHTDNKGRRKRLQILATIACFLDEQINP